MGAAAATVDDHARALLQWLVVKRKVGRGVLLLMPWPRTFAKESQGAGVESRPLVFICHSLGGILVKSVRVYIFVFNTGGRVITDCTRMPGTG